MLVEVAPNDRQPAERPVEQVGPPTPTDQIADRVTDDRTGDRSDNNCPQWDEPLRGRHAAEDHRDLSGENEPHECRRFQRWEREYED